MIGNLTVEGVSAIFVLLRTISFLLNIFLLISYEYITSNFGLMLQGDRCNLDLVTGCTDPSSPLYDPLANVDDGSCPLYSDSEDVQ